MTERSGAPGWLEAGADVLYTVLHRPMRSSRGACAVLIVPPFGWHEVCSERGRREWAGALCAAGYPTLRFDLPGTGESSASPRDHGLFESWLSAVAGAAESLRRESGEEHVVALGIGTGATIALRSLAAGARLDGLVLWGGAESGQRCLREIRAHSAIAAARWDRQPEGDHEPGIVEMTGYVMTEATVTAVSASNVRTMDLKGSGRPVLVLGRDEHGVDGGLVTALEAAGFDVEPRPCGGYAAFVDDHPDRNRRPDEAIALSVAWLENRFGRPGDGTPAPGSAGIGARPERTLLANFAGPDGSWSEQLIDRPTSRGISSGVLCEPSEVTSDDTCFVLMNHGTRRRCGPHRMWVEASRRWASQGYRTARVDLDGLGDSDGERNSEATRHTLVESLCDWLDDIAERSFASRFVLVGLSAGAINSLAAARISDRVVGVLAINPIDPPLTEAYRAELRRRHTMVTVRDACVALWRRQTPPRVSRKAVLRSLGELILGKGLYRQARRQRRQLPEQFSTWRDRGVEVALYLGREERILDWMIQERMFARLDEWPNLTLETPEDVWDHDIRALWVQQAVHAWMDRIAVDMVSRRLGSNEGSVARRARRAG